MAGYIRQDTGNTISNGNVADPSIIDSEYDAIVAAFNATTGHTHDGTSAEGAPITVIGPVQDIVASATVLRPKTDDAIDLGSASFEWKDLYIDGTANLDTALIGVLTATTFTSTGIDDNATSVAITIDSSENVGIGTTNPGDLLHLSKASPLVRFTDTDVSQSWRIGGSGTNFIVQDVTGGSNNVVVIEAGAPATSVRIDASGNVGLGEASPDVTLHVNSGTDNIVAGFESTDASALISLADDGGSCILGNLNGALLLFSGGSAGDITGSSATKYLTLGTSGSLVPGTDNTQQLGSASFRWSEIFAGTGTINTSDREEKDDFTSISAKLKRIGLVAKGLLVQFKYKEAKVRKGSGARIHFGISAQDLYTAFEDEGLDPFEYGVLCKDEWWEYRGDTYESEDSAPREAVRKEIYGIRYDELNALILSSI